MEHKILCSTGSEFGPKAKAILETVGTVRYASPAEDLRILGKDASVLVVQLGRRIDRSLIDALPNLRVIATATTGLDHIDEAYAKQKGIRLLSLKGETAFLRSVTATAELACGLMIALVRRIPAACRSVQDGRWDREAFRGQSLAGKTLGIIGYGRLGKMMARYGKALGMTVIHTDPASKKSMPLEQLLREADVVSLHVPLTAETEGMIDARALALLKSSAVVVNTSRGRIVDEEAMLEALQKGSIAGYATDVLGNELEFGQHGAQNPLIDYAKTHDTVLITPHIGGTTAEAREATDIFIAQKVRSALSSPAPHP